MRVTGEKSKSLLLPVRLTDQLRIEPTTAQLRRRLSSAIKSIINHRFVLANRATMRIHTYHGKQPQLVLVLCPLLFLAFKEPELTDCSLVLTSPPFTAALLGGLNILSMSSPGSGE